MITSESIAYFPWAILCPQSNIVKQAKADTLTRLSLRTYVTASCMLVALCIVGQRHDKDNNMSCGLDWCCEEVKYLMDIWTDDHISQILDTTHKNSEVFKIVSEQIKERSFECSVQKYCA